MQIIITNSYKSIPQGIEFNLPAFSIITGRNGSGKTHLLEAIANRDAQVTNNRENTSQISYFGFNRLNPQIGTVVVASNQSVIKACSDFWYSSLRNIVSNYKEKHPAPPSNITIDSIFQEHINKFHGINKYRDACIKSILENSGKSLDQLVESDVIKYGNSFTDRGSIFSYEISLLFKHYIMRVFENDIKEVRARRHPEKGFTYLSENEFIQRFGLPPWELLNDILRGAGLSYRVKPPDDIDYDTNYYFSLIDTEKNIEISVDDLSSGEKILMSLALASYNTEQGGVKPDLLLLDEPDAPLHPSFSKLLIDTLIETIVKKAGVNVIMTSHSPSTVAMAPEGSVFEIDHDSKIPKPVNNNYAIKVLTKGIDFLRVAYEKRRQIFVESKYDVEYFEHLYEILKEDNCFSFSPVFLEPHSGSSNCTDVINIVNKLTDAGSDLAFGIIDFDGKNKSKDKVFVLGDAQRYAIENYILDPIYVALALIRENKKHFSDFGITTKKSYISASDLSQDECQLLVNNFLSQIGTKISGDNLKPVSLKNGFVVNYPESFLLQQGHDYENSINEKFAELKAIAKGQGDSALKKAILKNTIRDFPKFLPIELEETFRKILG